MSNHYLRISEKAWYVLREIAYRKETKMKTVLDDIIDGKIDPSQYGAHMKE